VTDHYEIKRRALDCHTSQFTTPGQSGSVATRLNTPLFRQLIESRDAQFGALAGVTWAEGFVVREPVMRGGLLRSPI
jgi:LmbE family N-acetylglucosaminyl deacetylase